MIDPTLLERIKAVQRSLCNPRFPGLVPPMPPPPLTSLVPQKIVMVDDGHPLLQGFAAPLLMATEGEADFILVKDQDETALVQEIVRTKPTIVLMDKSLEKRFDGPDITRQLMVTKEFTGSVIGFSLMHDERLREIFRNAGAIGCVDKNLWEMEVCLQQISKVIAAKPAGRQPG